MALTAKEAGVANGSLFTHIETKSALLNELYPALERDRAATEGLRTDRKQAERLHPA